MRRGLIIGLTLAGWVATQGSGFAQFAADRTNPPPAPAQPPTPPPSTPASPVANPPSFPTPPRPTLNLQPSLTPAAPQPQQPPAASHAWYVRPEYGPWMICVKSYTGPESRELAEELVKEIRQTHKAGAYLFSWGAEERQKEEERRQMVRKQLAEEYAPFLAVREQMKNKANTQGVEFIDTPVKVRVPQVEYKEQWAVLVGGFKDMDTARRALDVVRKWEPPKNTKLMDQAVIARSNGAEGNKEQAFINPFATAMTAPNPSIRRANSSEQQAADPAIAKLNESEDLSLLKARKPWTLMVKRFVVPTHVQTKGGDLSVVDRLFSGDNSSKWLEATAKQARMLAQALRNSEMKPHPYESFVLHYRTESIVAVGQFDSPDDPAMLEAWRVLSNMTFRVDYKDGRAPEMKKMFDAVIPMQVPK